jgi:hypothetical protein
MDKHCYNCGAEVREKLRFCSECGVDLNKALKTNDELVREMRQFKPEPRKPKREPEPPNKFDEGVRDFFTSRTFKTLLTLFLGGACCIGLIYLTIAGTMLSFFKVLFGQ